MAFDCPREHDVIDAIASRRWPDRADEELRAHVASCAVCSDVAEVVSAITLEEEVASEEVAPLPSAEIVWWRAQTRARAEAARRASLPMTIMHALSAACFAGLAATVLGSAAWLFRSSIDAMAGWGIYLTTLEPATFLVRGVIFAVMLWVILAPIAVYLATADE